jgi:predicted nucleic acid-binding protein
MKQRIYIDTSVVGGYYDAEFAEATKALFERLKDGTVVFVVSEVLYAELAGAPAHVQALLESCEDRQLEYVPLSQEAKDLANAYITEQVVGKTSMEDCQHIAMATLCKADVLASWNFKHIVNLARIKGYNAVNLKMGYAPLEIRNPKELINYGTR